MPSISTCFPLKKKLPGTQFVFKSWKGFEDLEPAMADDNIYSFPLRSHSQRASLWYIYDDARLDGNAPANNVLAPMDVDELPSKWKLDNPSPLPHDDSPREDLPKYSPEIPIVMKRSPATSKPTIATSEISSFNLPSPLSTPYPSEPEETHNRIDPSKSSSSAVLFAPAEKIDREYGRWKNSERDPEKEEELNRPTTQ